MTTGAVIPGLTRDPYLCIHGSPRIGVRGGLFKSGMTSGDFHARAVSVSISTLLPVRAERINVAVSGNSLAK